MNESFFSRKKLLLFIFSLSILTLSFLYIFSSFYSNVKNEKPTFWEFRSVDTMKYSRDTSREKLNDRSFDIIIDRQIKQIAEVGATHVAIATPYDEEFLPILKRWVKAARKYELKVWFRGNWSGWEEWFEYPEISRTEHIKKTEMFILQHPELFEDGDVFSACPECENGGPGDPRMNNDAKGHKKFLIDEYKITKSAFKTIKKDVKSNYHSMNGDVAKLIMDRETTAALDGLVVVDHYVSTPEKLVKDIKQYAAQSGGKVILGEFGAPIPDIHGEMTEEEQAKWLANAFQALVQTEDLIGINYWTGVGGSTELWSGGGTPKKAVAELKKVYDPEYVTISIKNEARKTVPATLSTGDKSVYSENGKFSLIYLDINLPIHISANGYQEKNAEINGKNMTIILKKENEDIEYKFQKFLQNILP